MKKLLFTLLLLPLLSSATNYYVSNAGNNSSNGLTQGTAWLTLARVTTAGQAGTIVAGDSVLFRRGDEFTSPDQFNGFQWWGWGGNTCASGTSTNPIVFSAYGVGAKPNFIFPNPASEHFKNRSALSFEGVDYIIVDGLQFNDTRVMPVSKTASAYTTAGVVFGESGSGAESNHCIIRNCYFYGVGNGVVAVGDYNQIVDNVMEEFGNIYFNSGFGGDYGANAITLTGDRNYVARNTISGAWAYSEDFGLNGGAIEFFGTNTNSKIERNTFIDCGGVGEFGASDMGAVCENDTFAYNLILNVGGASYVNVSGSFAIEPDNLCWFNNVNIENSYSRFSGVNFGTGFTSFPTWPTLPQPEEVVFTNNGSPSASVVWNLKNNIFIVDNGLTVMGKPAKSTHTNNLYRLTGGSSAGTTLGISEVASSDSLFVSEMGNPSSWDYHLIVGSPAVGIGQVITGLTTDYFGLGLIGVRNAGISNSVSGGGVVTDNIRFPVKINGVYYKGWKN